MEDAYTTIDKDYLEAFNTGYNLSKETGLKVETLDKLKPKQLEKMKIDQSRLDIIKQGMKQHSKDKEYLKARELQKEKSKKINEQSKDRGISR